MSPLRLFVLPLLVVLGGEAFASTPIVAVFGVEDKTGQLGKSERRQLTDYLTSKVAQGGAFNVVPRGQIQDRLRKQKKASFKRCFDQKCQIDIGRELAASKSLSTQIVKIGTRCAVLLTLFDLRKSTTERSASAKADCSADALVGGLEKGVEEIKRQAKPTGPTAVSATGGLYIKSKPSGASVWLDGKKMTGVTPLTITKVSPGEHFLELRTGDYRLSKKLKVAADRFTNLAFRLKKIRGKLEVISNPPEADIYLDDRRVGRSPTILSDIEAGKYHLKLRKTGYLVAHKSIRITGKRQSITVTLPQAAVLAVRSQPYGATIHLDGKDVGSTPAELYVKPGNHEVKLVIAGQPPWVREVDATVQKTTVISADLVPKTPTVAAPAATVPTSPPETDFPSDAEEVDDQGGGTPTWGYVALGIGVASLATAGILYGVGLSNGGDAHEKYEAATDPAEIEQHWSDVESAENLLVGGHVALGIGVAAVGVWVYSMVSGRRSAAKDVAWNVGWTGRSVSVVGRF